MNAICRRLLLIIFFGLEVAHAQQVLGVVVEIDQEGKESPLPGVNVRWLNSPMGVVTKANGVFLIDRSLNDNKLILSYVGFVTDTLEVGEQTNLKVVLHPDVMLDEVTVEGRKLTSGIDHSRGVNTVVMSEKELFKAACCNLSESFETNPSVDVSFTDALTGTRQIQMLGLAGPNILISVENMPGVRGLASSQGIQFIPGTWINSIEVTKGVGSVVNGYESIAGQINVELKKPQDSEKLYINGYVNQSARSEVNLNYTKSVGKKWATTFLLHGSARPFEMDQNGDSFLDFPVSNQLNFINRWIYHSGNGWLGQFGVKVIKDDKRGGQLDFSSGDKFTSNRYGFEINTNRYELWGKLGYLFKNKPYKSVGLQLASLSHNHDSYFGYRLYNADENSFYANLIYQSIISNTSHKFKAGLSFLFDQYDEVLENKNGENFVYNNTPQSLLNFDRRESVPGAFVEYTYDNVNNFTIIGGIRADVHNLFGVLITPRVHLKYMPTATTTIRASMGSGTRLANLISENSNILTSSREIVFEGASSGKAYGYKQDLAFNYGVNLSQDFTLDYRPGTIAIDYFNTNFKNQVVLDLDNTARKAIFFPLTGQSVSNSLQFQLDYELIRRLDVRLAYRWIDVKTDYMEGTLQKPLQARHRAFINLAYETKNKWAFDLTVQTLGKQRLPDTSQNPDDYQLDAYSQGYTIVNTQLTKSVRNFSVYLGLENITNFRLKDPIVASNDPFGPYFDASMVWGPIFGRMVYAGFRYKLKD